jgi:KDO2-lipid IV(A) lauroyltransferase
MNNYIIKGRLGFMKSVIKRTDMRSIVKALKKDEVVWYPPDQDYGREHAVYVPFFGVTAATITATSRLVKFNQSPVVMLSYYRDDKGHYFLEFSPAPEGFPSGDDTTDATLINAALEKNIRKAPTQYMWTHRRFKNQPDNTKYYK